MKQIMKIGGMSAIGLTLIYIIGIVMNASMLDTSGITDPIELVQFMADHQGLMTAWITLLYVVFGIVLIPLTIALYELMMEKAGDRGLLAKTAAAFGFIWSGLVIASGMVHNIGMGTAIDMLAVNPEKAGDFFSVITSIHVGLGGGNEVPGAMWTLLISIAAIQTGLFKKWINGLGLIVGIAGILTIVPSLFDSVVMVFALGQMVWWIGLGLLMIRDKVFVGKPVFAGK